MKERNEEGGGRSENVWKQAERKPASQVRPKTPWSGRKGAEEAEASSPVRKLADGQWLESVCGLQSVLSFYAAKPAALERLFFDPETAPELGDLCRYLAKERKVYRQVDAAELVRVGGTQSHGGVVAIVRRRSLEPATAKAAEFWGRSGLALLILDGISDPHALGGIARVAAYFGVEKLLLANTKRQARPSASAYRSARGGLDRMDVRLVDNAPIFLKSIQASHFVVGLDAQGKSLSAIEGELEAAKAVGKPVALALGHEELGLSLATKESCQALVSLRGAGALERPGLVVEAALLLQRCVAAPGLATGSD